MKEKFKVGDRVKCIKEVCLSSVPLKGEYGTIKTVYNGRYGVEFDNFICGHSCCNNTKKGHGWYCSAEELEFAKPQTIVIYRDGNKVIALDKSTGERAEARCNPCDTFDFYEGVSIAFARLSMLRLEHVPEPTPLNTKVVFVDGCGAFEKGRIYPIRNGKIFDSAGKIFPLNVCFYSMEDVESYFSRYGINERDRFNNQNNKVIEIKED